MSTALDLTSSLNTPVIPVSGKPRMVYFLLEIGGGENAQSLPMNIGLVIDVSESMHIRMVTEEQFKELVGRRNIKEILKDGIPAWEIESVSPEMESSTLSQLMECQAYQSSDNESSNL